MPLESIEHKLDSCIIFCKGTAWKDITVTNIKANFCSMYPINAQSKGYPVNTLGYRDPQ